MSPATAALRRRARWQRRYKPDHIKLLLVAEAPPTALDRYFYFPNVNSQDSLFRYTSRMLLGIQPDRQNKEATLSALRASGVFLIDAELEPRRGPFSPDIHALGRRIRRLDPEKVLLIKASVYDRCASYLIDQGLPLVPVRIPFPGSGQQRRFELAFRRALRRAGWRQPKLGSVPSVYVSKGTPEPEIPGGCRVVAASTGLQCLNPGRHLIDDVVRCTTHRKAFERAQLRSIA